MVDFERLLENIEAGLTETGVYSRLSREDMTWQEKKIFYNGYYKKREMQRSEWWYLDSCRRAAKKRKGYHWNAEINKMVKD